MKMKLMLAAAVMAVALTSVSANAGVIVSEDFGGNGSGGLNGTAADTFSPGITAAGGSAMWVANSGFLDNGLVSNISRRAAYLNMGSYINNAKGTAKGLFTLTMTISETSGTSWLSLGFGQENTPSTDKDFTNASSLNPQPTLTTNGLGTIIYRVQTSSTGGELDMYGGPGSANAIDGPDFNTGPRTLTVTLDLTPAGGTYGKVTWSDSVLGVINSYTYTAARTFNSILITGSATGTISNLTLSQAGQSSPAQAPDPEGYETDVEVDLSSRLVPGAVSWLSPDVPDDPNIVTVFGYNVYMDPNETKVANATPASADLLYKSLQSGGQTGTSFDPGANLAYETTYYWRVDSLVDYDFMPGSTVNDANTIAGSMWSFTTASDDPAPTVVIDTPNTITWANQPVQLNATVTDTGASPVTITWTSSQDPNTVFSDIHAEDPTVTVDRAYPASPYVVLTCSVQDGANPTPNTDTVVVRVYADACAAARGAGRAALYPMDFMPDCVINLEDFVPIAEEWLTDYALTDPYTGFLLIESFDDVTDWQWVWNGGSAYGSQSVSAVADPSGERPGIVVKYDYDNSGADGSDVALPLEAGTVNLSNYDRMTLWYKCAPGNTLETKLYLNIICDNNDGDPSNDSSAQIQIRDSAGSTQSPSPGEWLQWTINLHTDLIYGQYSTNGDASLADITDFDTLLIGSWSSGGGGTGTIYFDKLELIDLLD
jgi:hypothetical protein